MNPDLSVVVPLFNEAETVRELTDRIHRAVSSLDSSLEVILVDDASRDATATQLDQLASEGLVRAVHLPSNRGQLGATLAGLAVAEGDWVAVLDGDLQDPPELLGTLLDAARSEAASVDVVFAVKLARADPGWMRLGSHLYGLLGRALSTRFPPLGAGSYCLMTRSLVQRLRVARAPNSANLSALICALGVRARTVPYAKAARRDGVSRVGFRGLVVEAVGSLWLLYPSRRRRGIRYE